MRTLVVSEPNSLSNAALTRLRASFDVSFSDGTSEGLVTNLVSADALWVGLRRRIGHDLLGAAPKLKVLATPTTGLDHIDMVAAQCHGVRVLSLQNCRDMMHTVRGAAEHTLALCLALIRNLPAAVEHARNGGWQRDLFRGQELCGKTVGIVGYGRLGRIVSRYLLAFEAQIIAVDPNIRPEAIPPGVELVELDELLTRSDIVSVHVNLTEENRKMFGCREFDLMKRGSWFINTARGGLVDEVKLLEALQSGKLAGAALDVLADEYSADLARQPLRAYAREHPNLIITPHIGGCTVESMEKTELFLALCLIAEFQSLMIAEPAVAGQLA